MGSVESIEELVVSATTDDQLLAAIVERLSADSGTIHLLKSGDMLHLVAATPGLPAPVLEKIREVPVGKGMAGLAVERAAPVDACNIQTDTSGDVRPGALATGLAGAIVVPILRGNEVIGALGVANRAERTFTQDEIEALLAAGRAIAAKHSEMPSGGTAPAA
ncbi:MAG: GAF domain-containing protein [Methyloligella sp. ZOD6]